jgi:hypothetical protein
MVAQDYNLKAPRPRGSHPLWLLYTGPSSSQRKSPLLPFLVKLLKGDLFRSASTVSPATLPADYCQLFPVPSSQANPLTEPTPPSPGPPAVPALESPVTSF